MNLHDLPIPSVISTLLLIHAPHILSAFGAIATPHSQQATTPTDMEGVNDSILPETNDSSLGNILQQFYISNPSRVVGGASYRESFAHFITRKLTITSGLEKEREREGGVRRETKEKRENKWLDGVKIR